MEKDRIDHEQKKFIHTDYSPLLGGSERTEEISSPKTHDIPSSILKAHEVWKMVDDIKLPIFKGLGSEDPDQFWFLAYAIWTIRQITSVDVKNVQLITSLRERVITWYMKYSMTN